MAERTAFATSLISAAVLAAFASPAFAQNRVAQAPANEQRSVGVVNATGEQTGQATELGVRRIGVGRRTTSERSLSIVPGFSASFTATNNVDLEPRERRQAGSVFELAPFVGLKLRRPGSTADVLASIRAKHFSNSDFVDNRIDGDVSADADLSIVGDSLRLRGDGRSYRVDETGLGGTGVTGGARTQDTTRFNLWRLNPYSVGRLTETATYEAGYEFEYIDRGIQSDANRLYGEVASTGFADGRIGLLARADLAQVNYENDFEYDNNSALLGVSWAFGGRLKIGAGAFYQGIDVITIDGKNSSIGPALFWDWRASERSALQGQIADTYYGENMFVRFSQLFSRWVLSANYKKLVEDGNRASSLLFTPIRATSGSTRRAGDRTLNEFSARLSERDLELDSGAEQFVTTLDSALVYDNTLSLSAAFVRPRNAGLFSLFYSDREAATRVFSSTGDRVVNQWGGYGAFDYLIDSRNSVRLVGQYRKSDLPSTGRSALFTGIDVSWRRKLTPGASLRFGVRHSIQDGDGGAPSYGETAASITYLYRYQ